MTKKKDELIFNVAFPFVLGFGSITCGLLNLRQRSECEEAQGLSLGLFFSNVVTGGCLFGAAVFNLIEYYKKDNRVVEIDAREAMNILRPNIQNPVVDIVRLSDLQSRENLPSYRQVILENNIRFETQPHITMRAETTIFDRRQRFYRHIAPPPYQLENARVESNNNEIEM